MVILNSRGITYRINSSKLKTLFASNHVEVDTDTVCCCSSFNVPCIVKSQRHQYIYFDDFFIWSSTTRARLAYANKDSFVSIRNVYEKFGSTTCLLLPQLHTITSCDTVSYSFNVLKRVVFERVVFERTSSGIPPFNMIVKLGSSNKQWSDKIYPNVYHGEDVEGIVKTRMRQ